jgi:hypothetical protein
MKFQNGPERCKSCGSSNQNNYIGEMSIRCPGFNNIDEPSVWVFPEVIICVDCGSAEFVVPQTELDKLPECESVAV